MVMGFELIRDQYFNVLTNKLTVGITKYPFGCGVYQYYFALTARENNPFGCIFKKRSHVRLVEHQCVVSVSNYVNIMNYHRETAVPY